MFGALLATNGTLGGIGAAAGLALLFPMEAGLPIPIPADLVMLGVAARVSAGDVPMWAAILLFEAVAISVPPPCTWCPGVRATPWWRGSAVGSG